MEELGIRWEFIKSILKYIFLSSIIFNRLSKGGCYIVRLHIYFLMFVNRYFFSASQWSHFKNFLIPLVVNLSACLFNILFGYNFLENRTMARKFWYVLELHRFALHVKNCFCIVHKSFYRMHQKFQNISIFYLFLMTQIVM